MLIIKTARGYLPTYIFALSLLLLFGMFSILPFSAYAQSSTLNDNISACNDGDKNACADAGMHLADHEKAEYDPFLSLRYLQLACTAKNARACGRLSLIYWDGEGDVEPDMALAGSFAREACAAQDRNGCEVAEAVFANSASPEFDAQKALRYRRANCDFGNMQSCIFLARIYYNLEDHLPAEQIAAKACASGIKGNEDICAFAKQLKDARIKVEQAEAARIAQIKQARADAAAQRYAQQQRASAVVDSFLNERDYDGAIYAAIYHSRLVPDAERALRATINAGAIGSVFIDNLYVLDYWFPSGDLNRIVNREIQSRKSAQSCGIYNCTNTPGASSRRWAAQNGNRNNGYRPSSSGGYTPLKPMKSSAQIAAETRNKYRHVNCTMNKNPSYNLCR